MARPSPELKSTQQIKLSAAKKVAARLAITRRRVHVADLLSQHFTMREIATRCEVALSTVVLDKRAIDAELAEVYTTEYQWRRERELESLDKLERDVMNKITFAVDTEDELKWTNVQLRIMGMRAKWLGYDVPLKSPNLDTNQGENKGPNTSIQDNRSVTNIYINRVDEEGNSAPIPFIESLGEALNPKEPAALNRPIDHPSEQGE